MSFQIRTALLWIHTTIFCPQCWNASTRRLRPYCPPDELPVGDEESACGAGDHELVAPASGARRAALQVRLAVSLPSPACALDASSAAMSAQSRRSERAPRPVRGPSDPFLVCGDAPLDRSRQRALGTGQAQALPDTRRPPGSTGPCRPCRHDGRRIEYGVCGSRDLPGSTAVRFRACRVSVCIHGDNAAERARDDDVGRLGSFGRLRSASNHSGVPGIHPSLTSTVSSSGGSTSDRARVGRLIPVRRVSTVTASGQHPQGPDAGGAGSVSQPAPPYGLFTSAANSVHVPGAFPMPTGFSPRLRSLIQRRALQLYGNICRVVPPPLAVNPARIRAGLSITFGGARPWAAWTAFLIFWNFAASAWASSSTNDMQPCGPVESGEASETIQWPEALRRWESAETRQEQRQRCGVRCRECGQRLELPLPLVRVRRSPTEPIHLGRKDGTRLLLQPLHSRSNRDIVSLDLELPGLLHQVDKLHAPVGPWVELGVRSANMAPNHAEGDPVVVVGPHRGPDEWDRLCWRLLLRRVHGVRLVRSRRRCLLRRCGRPAPGGRLPRPGAVSCGLALPVNHSLRHVFTELPKAQSLAEAGALPPVRLNPAAPLQDSLRGSFPAARQ